jgi:hypothetical protein
MIDAGKEGEERQAIMINEGRAEERWAITIAADRKGDNRRALMIPAGKAGEERREIMRQNTTEETCFNDRCSR